jgi:hypothetical protein
VPRLFFWSDSYTFGRRTWQDWSLRNARKTAFLAAAHFYCRQLGISFHHSPQPVLVTETEEQFAKDGLRIPVSSDIPLSPSPTPSSGEPTSPRINDVAVDAGEANETVTAVLGFIPPPDKRTSLTRAHKSRLRKRNMRDGGDGVGGG